MVKAIRRRVERFERLTIDLNRQLKYGNWFVTKTLQSREDFVVAWRIHGKLITAEWPDDLSRPYAWWLLMHLKERPIVRPQGEQVDRELRSQHERFGYLHTSIFVSRVPGECVDFGPWQEPEREYLVRNGFYKPKTKGRKHGGIKSTRRSVSG
jgi:hypothetical protein